MEYDFRNVNGTLVQQQGRRQKQQDTAVIVSRSPANILEWNDVLPAALDPPGHREASYFSHFQSHVRHILPGASVPFIDASPGLRYAVLCLSASNLSMLHAQVQSRVVSSSGQDTNARRTVFSPLANALHHSQAREYHDQALWHCRNASPDELKHQAPAFLVAHVLLAYYHHASTNHLRFRLAVWNTVRFVAQNRASLAPLSDDHALALQMWYRLCASHRPAKPPALLLEGEGASSFGPNLFPGAHDNDLYLQCILGMSVDDLIYDILVKTIEIRSKFVLFRCVADRCQVSELSGDIGVLAHGVLNKMLGRPCVPDEYAEAQEGFVRGSHLLGLLDVQKDRLEVWKSRLHEDQLPDYISSATSSTPPSHRDAMNALYCVLCEIVFEEARVSRSEQQHPESQMDGLAHMLCRITNTIDLAKALVSDVYTFSLAETLLQLVLLWRSDAGFQYILDVLWTRLEGSGRGYEHSHYPTHLVKRIIAQVAAYWGLGHVVCLALPAATEDISKLRLLDIERPVDIVVCGYNINDGRHFIERISLP